MNEMLAFDDVLLVPNFSFVQSRKDVNLEVNLMNKRLYLPVISSNMDTITEEEMANAMVKSGAVGALHRFCSVERNVEMYKKSPQNTFVSIGVSKNELERAQALNDAGANKFIIDIAHGASIQAVNQYVALRELLGNNIDIMVGNFATKEGIEDFNYHCRLNQKPDAWKSGIGGGCFVAGTRVLMSNGTYKNIEEIQFGDRIINKKGIPVKVINKINSGFKKVLKYKTNNFYKESYATPDHKHWVGDFETIKNIDDHSITDVLDKLTKRKESKYKWKRLDQTEKTVCLLPNKINFELNTTFQINLESYCEKKKVFKTQGYNNLINSDYNLGYIFGTFLGDGSTSFKIYSNTTLGAVSWYFGKKELEIVNKLTNCLKNSLNIEAKLEEKDNMYIIKAYCLPLSKLLIEFGKRDKKSLPEKYLINDKEYLTGIYDGLIDSDGHIDGNRKSLHNTSSKLIEQFGIINQILFGYFPSMIKNKPSIGGLKNCNIDNCKESYIARTVGNPNFYLTKDYQVVRINKIEEIVIEMETFDIEVDCETHSFIANNVIVHNSVCTTRIVTGCGIPTLASVLDCVKTRRTIVADGGMKNSGDIAKVLAAGAKAVMLGGMLAGTDETPGKLDYNKLGIIGKTYRGSASLSSYVTQGKIESHRCVEGEYITVRSKGPVEHTLKQIEGGLRSALSYVGATNLEEFREKARFVQVTNSGVTESKAHGVK